MLKFENHLYFSSKQGTCSLGKGIRAKIELRCMCALLQKACSPSSAYQHFEVNQHLSELKRSKCEA